MREGRIRAKKEKNWVRILYYIIEDNGCGKRERRVREAKIERYEDNE